MPRYFFHLHDGEERPDEEGTTFPDLTAAQIGAVRLAGGLMHSEPEPFWSGEEWTMRVTDDRDLTLFTLHFYVNIAPAIRPAIDMDGAVDRASPA